MDNESNGTQNMVRAAAGAANIARGAAYGGLYGAAVETVKSFFPEIVKGSVILLFVIILGPLLIFTALPNILFGFDSATAPDIVDFTASAHELEAIYQNIDRKNQSLIERLVESILPDFMTDDEPDYDDYEVTKSLGNVNHYWLVAIGSVRYKQDLNIMDEPTIEQLLFDKLTYTASIKDRILSITVRDLTPEAYMDKLGFTQEEKDWAALLYSVLADNQKIGVEDSDGPVKYNTDYGDITFTNADTPVVYYNQTDSRWGNKLYGRTGTIGWEGCGPTALAIVVASMTDNKVTPYDVAQWSAQNGYRCEGNGSYHSLIPNGGEHYGLTVTKIGKDSKKLVEALESGKLVIAIMAPGHFTTTGHFIVLRGITEEGNVLVADPASVKRSNQEWALGIITNEAATRAGAGGPFWVFSR